MSSLEDNHELYRKMIVRVTEESLGDGLLILSAKVASNYTNKDYRNPVNTRLLDEIVSMYEPTETKAGEIAREIRFEMTRNGAYKFYHNANQFRVFGKCMQNGLVENMELMRLMKSKPLVFEKIEYVDDVIEVLKDNYAKIKPLR